MIFIDTGAFLARHITRDQYHERAINHWNALRGRQCITSNFVLDETITLLARRTSYQFAAERAQVWFHADALTILRPDQDDEHLTLQFFQKYADQSISFTDCISFALMQKYNIKTAFSFDRHFQILGFQMEP